MADLASSKDPSPRRIGRTVARLLLLTNALVGVAAFVLLIFETQSVLMTGFPVVVIGLVTALVGAASRRWEVTAIGATHVFVAILFVALVWLLWWGPAQARWPFIILSALCLAVTLPLSVRAFFRTPAGFAKWCCQKCGYPLFGLTTKACPECGAPFNPEYVNAHAPPEAPRNPGNRS